MPLSDVEKFIVQNKHLPNVPSADEVVKDGIDMATMDAKLLEKIEELTLYVIKLNKEVEELKRLNKSSNK
jgi:trimeric autotransporter adhesin